MSSANRKFVACLMLVANAQAGACERDTVSSRVPSPPESAVTSGHSTVWEQCYSGHLGACAEALYALKLLAASTRAAYAVDLEWLPKDSSHPAEPIDATFYQDMLRAELCRRKVHDFFCDGGEHDDACEQGIGEACPLVVSAPYEEPDYSCQRGVRVRYCLTKEQFEQGFPAVSPLARLSPFSSETPEMHAASLNSMCDGGDFVACAHLGRVDDFKRHFDAAMRKRGGSR